MKKILATLALSGLLLGGVPSVYAQDSPSSSAPTTSTQSGSSAPADVDVKVESSNPAPSAPSVQITEESQPSTHTTSTSTHESREIVRDDTAEPASSNLGLFAILGGLGLVTALVLFAASGSGGSHTTVRRETVVH